jgi:hypothetical protein
MRVIEIACVGERPRRLVGDRGNLAIHVEELAYVQAEAFHDVLESVGVHRLIESLAQQILPALWIGEMAVDCEHDIVGDEALGGGKEAEVALHHAPLVFPQAVARFPERDVGLHRDLRRRPMVVASGKIFLPCPAIFRRQEMVHVRASVDHLLFIDADPGGSACDIAETCRIGRRPALDTCVQGVFGPFEQDRFPLLAGFAGWVIERAGLCAVDQNWHRGDGVELAVRALQSRFLDMGR